ncbi:MAG: hypothetical protein IH991_03120 [Planctomycetes bacterium]|nr:hypothetical protein [Planctomycetota bacterium]
MQSDLFFRVGGCAGSYAALSENRPVYDMNAPDLQRRDAFRRELYGGRTTSYFIRYQDTFIIVDHGLGIEPLSEFINDMLDAEGCNDKVIHCVQSHYHEDHVSGMHANALLYNKKLTLRYYSPELSKFRGSPGRTERPMMQEIMSDCFREHEWPVTLEMLDEIGARREHVEFGLGDELKMEDVSVKTVSLQHPGGCSGFRFEFPNKKTIVVATDYEPPDEPDSAIVEFFSGADLLISDIQYRDAEYDGEMAIGRMKVPRRGWGHGTPRKTLSSILKCAKKPNSVRIVHHEPKRTDMELRLFYEETVRFLKDQGADHQFEYEFAHDGDVYWI